MFTSIRIKQFKSVYDVVLSDLGPLTVFVGRNGAGKSNLLRAVDWIARVATTPASMFSRGLDQRDLSAELQLGDTAYRFSVSVEWGAPVPDQQPQVREKLELSRSQGEWAEVLSRENAVVTVEGRHQTIPIQPTTPVLPTLLALLPAEDEVLTHIAPVFNFFSRVWYYPLDEPTALPAESRTITHDEYLKWQGTVDGSGRNADLVEMKLIHLYLTNKEKLGEIKSLLGPSGIGLFSDFDIHHIKGTLLKSGELRPDLYILSYTPFEGSVVTFITYAALSHGTRRILRLVTSLIMDDANVLLLEHPEDGIHRGLLLKLIGIIKGYMGPAQALIASHSPGVFDLLKPEQVRLVSMQNGLTNARSLSSNELDAASSFINSDGPFSEFLQAMDGD